MIKAVVAILTIAIAAFAWHLLLWSHWSGKNITINPITDVAVVTMIGPSELGLTDPEEAATFEGMRDLTGIPIGEHKLNNFARQYLDVYAMMLPYRISITNRRRAESEPDGYYQSDSRSVPQLKRDSTQESEANSVTPSAGDSTYKKYTNPRFGFSITFPESFSAKGSPENGDGIEFISADERTLLSVSGENNPGMTLKTYYELALKDVTGELGYHSVGSNWFVVTFTEGDSIRYQKTFVGTESQNTFVLTYPVEQSRTYDGVLTTIGRQFTPGDLDHSH